MNVWRTTTLGDIGEIFDGPHATPSRINEGPYFLNIASLDNGRLDLSKSDHVSSEDFKRWTRRVTPQAGDLLFSYETRLGQAALMPPDVTACLGRRMALLRPRKDAVIPAFLLYYYLSPAMQAMIEQNTIHGATVNRIALSTMPSWEVSLPPLSEQRAIATVLGALDDKIASNNEVVDSADQLAGAMVRRHLTGHSAPLSSVAAITMGTSPKGDTMNEDGHGSPFFQGVRDFEIRFPSNRVWTTTPIRTANARDILVSVRAPVGRVNIAPQELTIGRGLAAVRSTTGHQMTLFHILKDAGAVWLPYEAVGTVFGSINRGQLHDLEVPTVDEDAQTELERDVTALEDHIAALLHENKLLAATRDALLPALMSGKLRVKDAERQVEAVV